MLVGTLAGKTRLVQAIAEHCGIDRRDSSADLRAGSRVSRPALLYHIDAYRLRDGGVFRAGPEEYFESRGSRSSNGPIAWRAVCRASPCWSTSKLPAASRGVAPWPRGTVRAGGGATAAESGV